MSSFFSSRLLLAIGLLLPPIAHGQANRPNADEAWTRLTERAADQRGNRKGPQESNQATDWAAIAAEARKFRQDFPDHPQARKAGKIELTARIMDEGRQAELSSEVTEAVEEYVRDTRNDVRDRVQLRHEFALTRIRQSKPATYAADMEAKAGHARELMREFTDQPDGFGYMLALARLASPEQGGALAEELLANEKTPDRFKPMARRAAERRALLNQSLRLEGAEAALVDARGKALVIYSWRTTDEGFLSIIKQMGKVPEVAFIGINLDADPVAARVVAKELPGTQFYDGGLEGPLARQLRFVLGTSVYLADAQGILRDLDAHRSPYDQLTGFLALSQGGVR